MPRTKKFTDLELKEHRQAACKAWDKAHPGHKNAVAKAWNAKHTVQVLIRAKVWNVLHPAQVKISEVNRMEKKAGRKKPKYCDVCKKAALGRAMHFDHCHKSGHFRGWLCYGCNAALGYAYDSPKILRKLASYLEADTAKQKKIRRKQ